MVTLDAGFCQKEIAASAWRARKDRFYEKHGFRVHEVALPERLFLERAESRAPADSLYVHQVDPLRSESCAPVMPCMNRLAQHGNPYPAAKDRTVIMDPHYEPFVGISHAVWQELARRGALALDGVDCPRARSLAERGLRMGAQELDRFELRDDVLRCVLDSLRDLALWGLITYERREFHARRFRLPSP
jgi:hypothetical protein